MALSKRPERDEPIKEPTIKPVIVQEANTWRLNNLSPVRDVLLDLRLQALEQEINYQTLKTYGLKIPQAIARTVIDTGEMLKTQLPPRPGVESYRRLYNSATYLVDLDGEVRTKFLVPTVSLGELNSRAWRMVFMIQEKGLKGPDGTRDIPGIREFIIKLAASRNIEFRKGAKEED